MKKVITKNPYITLNGFQSLVRHHLAKQDIREEQLRNIVIPNRGSVLDVGVGPGLYLRYWLELTKKAKINFVLFDESREALQLCLKESRKIGADNRVNAIQGNLSNIGELIKEKFDVVFIGNTLEYVSDPVDYIKKSIVPLLKKGGQLVVRELDCAIVNCSHVDPGLCTKVVYSRIESCKSLSQAPGKFHNPFMGRELGIILKSAGFKNVILKPYYCEFKGPLNIRQKHYLSQLHLNWYLEDQAGILSASDKKVWATKFDLNQSKCVLKEPNFFYVESEFLAFGHLHS